VAEVCPPADAEHRTKLDLRVTGRHARLAIAGRDGLREAPRSGLVRSRKVGRVRTCSIEAKALEPVERWIEERQAGWERRLDRLGAYLAEGDA